MPYLSIILMAPQMKLAQLGRKWISSVPLETTRNVPHSLSRALGNLPSFLDTPGLLNIIQRLIGAQGISAWLVALNHVGWDLLTRNLQLKPFQMKVNTSERPPSCTHTPFLKKETERLSSLWTREQRQLVWGLLKVFLPKACAQQSLCRRSLAQSFKATAIGSVTRGKLDKYERMWCMVWLSCVTVTVIVTWLLELVWTYAEF